MKHKVLFNEMKLSAGIACKENSGAHYHSDISCRNHEMAVEKFLCLMNGQEVGPKRQQALFVLLFRRTLCEGFCPTAARRCSTDGLGVRSVCRYILYYENRSPSGHNKPTRRGSPCRAVIFGYFRRQRVEALAPNPRLAGVSDSSGSCAPGGTHRNNPLPDHGTEHCP